MPPHWALGPTRHPSARTPIPPNQARPDADIYAIQADAGAIMILSANPVAGSPVDPVIEVLDASGTRQMTCRDLADDSPPSWAPFARDSTPLAFDDPFMNDDRTLETGPGAYLEFQAPGAPGTRATFYVRVFDWRGDARPDLVYEFSAHPH